MASLVSFYGDKPVSPPHPGQRLYIDQQPLTEAAKYEVGHPGARRYLRSQPHQPSAPHPLRHSELRGPQGRQERPRAHQGHLPNQGCRVTATRIADALVDRSRRSPSPTSTTAGSTPSWWHEFTSTDCALAVSSERRTASPSTSKVNSRRWRGTRTSLAPRTRKPQAQLAFWRSRLTYALGAESTQNSFPSGSARTTHDAASPWPTSTRRAP